MLYLLEHLQIVYNEKSGWSWLLTAAIALSLTVSLKLILRLMTGYLRRFTKRTHTEWDDIGLDIVDGLKMTVLFLWAFYFFTKTLDPSEAQQKLLRISVVLASVFQLSVWGLYLIKNWRSKVLDRRIEKDRSSAAALGLLYTGIQTIFLTVLLLSGLSNLGVNISALVTGLGVGGIAVALAAQNVLGDLLGSLSIVLDKPFVVGEFIVVGQHLGTVEQIGVKTTRLRSLSGEELIFSNKELLESRIQNYSRMAERRVVQNFKVPYSTSAELLEQIPLWIKEYIAEEKRLRFDRCHLAKYGEYSFDFEFVFYVLSPDYNIFMDLQQTLLMKITKRFRAEEVAFALPYREVRFEQRMADPSQQTPWPSLDSGSPN